MPLFAVLRGSSPFYARAYAYACIYACAFFMVLFGFKNTPRPIKALIERYFQRTSFLKMAFLTRVLFFHVFLFVRFYSTFLLYDFFSFFYAHFTHSFFCNKKTTDFRASSHKNRSFWSYWPDLNRRPADYEIYQSTKTSFLLFLKSL